MTSLSISQGSFIYDLLPTVIARKGRRGGGAGGELSQE